METIKIIGENLNHNWLNSNDMMKLCDKYNIEYKTIHFRQ